MYKKKNREIIIGSNNAGKIKEIRDLLPKTYKILTPAEFNLTKSPRETGKSFAENSLTSLIFLEKLQVDTGYKQCTIQDFLIYYVK